MTRAPLRRTAGVIFLVACGGEGVSTVADSGAGDGAVDAELDAGHHASDAGCLVREASVRSCGDADAGGCPALSVAGDPPAAAATSGNFRGYADPALANDPESPSRVWLAYSWPHVVSGVAPDGGAVSIASVSSHLARSDDQGVTFTFERELYAAAPTNDPEGSGENGISDSETVSLTSLTKDGSTTWYAAHLRYFQRPITGYNPKYGTSWTVRVGAAASPTALGDPDTQAKEAVLGVTNTATAYAPNARLDQLATLDVQHCAMLNNPTLFSERGSLYLIVECLAFVGTTPDVDNSSLQVFATVPNGEPKTWTWRHAGKLADVSLAKELGSETIQQPDVSYAADGTKVLLVTRAHRDPTVQVGTVGDGCSAVELASIDPPAIQRGCDGRIVVRARLDGLGLGACSHASRSRTGVVGHRQGIGAAWRVEASGVHP